MRTCSSTRLGRLAPWLDAAHAASVALLPAVAVVGFTWRSVISRGTGESRVWWGWLALYGPFLVPALLHGTFGRGWREAGVLVGTVAFAAALSLVARLPHRGLLVGGGLAIVLLAAAVTAERWNGARSWYALEAGAVQTLWIGVAGGVERVYGGGIDRAVRTWELGGETEALEGVVTVRRGVPALAAAEAPWDAALQHDTTPSVAELHVLWPAGDRTRRVVVALDPGEAWSDTPFRFEDPTLRDAPFVQLRLAVPHGQAVDVRAVRVRATGGPEAVARPLTTRPRARLWFDHFNTLGHVAATLALVAMTIAVWQRAYLSYLLVLGAAVVVGMATGSRATAMTLALGVVLHGIARIAAREPGASHWRGWLVPISIGLAVAVAALAGTTLVRSDGGFGPSRASIWAVAARGMVDHPLTGHPEPFATAFARAYPASEADAVMHAHNLWLDAGYRYGVAGLLAALVLVLGMVHRAWHRGRWYGLAIVVPLALLQLVDVTFWNVSVLMAVALGVNLEWGLVEGRGTAPSSNGPGGATPGSGPPGDEEMTRMGS